MRRQKLDIGNEFHAASLDSFGRGIQEKPAVRDEEIGKENSVF